MPKIVAKIKTGGDQIQINRRLTPPTAAEFQKMQACLQKQGITSAARSGQRRQNGQNGRRAGSAAAAAAAGRLPGRRRPRRVREVPARAAAALPRHDHDAGADAAAGRQPAADQHQELELHDRRRRPGDARHRRRHRGPGHPRALHRRRQGRRQARGARSPHVREPARAEGRLEAEPERHRRSPSSVSSGRRSAARPPTSTSRCRSCRCSRARRAPSTSSSSAPRTAPSVGDVQKQIETLYPRAQVASAKDVADSISGSLVDAASLSKRLGTALAILAAVAAFLLAILLTLSSVGKRVRELGTLKALGWTQWLVVRQVVGESLAQGVLGGLARRRPRHRRRARDRRVRPDADRELEHRRRRRLLRARPGHGAVGQRPGGALGADRGRRCCSPASSSPSSAAWSPALPAPSAPRASGPPTPSGRWNDGGRCCTTSRARSASSSGARRSSRRSAGSTSRSRRASSSRSRGRAARGRRRCCSCSAPSTGRAPAASSSRDAISPRSATASSPICG